MCRFFTSVLSCSFPFHFLSVISTAWLVPCSLQRNTGWLPNSEPLCSPCPFPLYPQDPETGLFDYFLHQRAPVPHARQASTTPVSYTPSRQLLWTQTDFRERSILNMTLKSLTRAGLVSWPVSSRNSCPSCLWGTDSSRCRKCPMTLTAKWGHQKWRSYHFSLQAAGFPQGISQCFLEWRPQCPHTKPFLWGPLNTSHGYLFNNVF